MADMLGEAYFEIRAKGDKLAGDLKKQEPPIKSWGNRIAESFSNIKGWAGKMSGALLGAAGAFGVITTAGGALAAVANEFREGFKAAEEQAIADRRLEGALIATGHAAGLSAEELKEYASQIQSATGVSDDSIQEFMASLTKFGNIHEDVFLEATQLAVDYSELMGKDLSGAAQLFGRALNDPVRGITLLRRQAILTPAQEKQIKTLAESGKGLEAQGVILAALRSKFQGAAAKLAEGPFGSLKKSRAELADLREELGEMLVPLEKSRLELQINLVKALMDSAPAIIYFAQTFTDAASHVMDVCANLGGAWRATWEGMSDTLEAESNFIQDLLDGLSGDIPGAGGGLLAGGETGGAVRGGMLFGGIPLEWLKAAGGGLTGHLLGTFMENIQNEKEKKRLDREEEKLKRRRELEAMRGKFAPGEFNFSTGKESSKKDQMKGFFGPTDYIKRLQESMLGDDTKKMLKAIEDGVGVEEEMLAELRLIKEKPGMVVQVATV
jgi:hypothetical protein